MAPPGNQEDCSEGASQHRAQGRRMCARPPPQGTCAPLCTRALPAPGSGGRRAQLWAGRGRCVRERAVGGGPSAELLQPRNRHRGPPCPGAVHAVQQPTGTAREALPTFGEESCRPEEGARKAWVGAGWLRSEP